MRQNGIPVALATARMGAPARVRAATRVLAAALAAAVGCLSAAAQDMSGAKILDAGVHHLGDDDTPEWTEGPAAPERGPLVIRFRAHIENRERTLHVVQRDIDDRWTIELNGVAIGTLRPHDDRRADCYPLPGGILREGSNVLRFVPAKASDDVTIGDVRLVPRTLRETLGLEVVRVRVHEKATRHPLPARVTVTLPGGALADVFYAETSATAVRRGVVYTARGFLTMELPRGDYVLYASRGMEWSLARVEVSVTSGPNDVVLPIAREVDTTGFIACDTHVHTDTFSGHGDASVEERLVTLAGEGVELAVATDPHHQTDYRPTQEAMSLEPWFTSITGTEVTTDGGRFLAFPLDPAGPLPDPHPRDWVRFVQDMRAKGARIVVLNPPRRPDGEKGLFGEFGLDRESGERERERGARFPLDAMELANASVMEDDPLGLFRDWFALLDHGERITAVGSSSSDTVAAPVGEGRTYVRSDTDDPARLDVDELLDTMLRGESSIALGIFCDVTVNGRGMGRLVAPHDGMLDVRLRVAAPGWARPETAWVFMDGEPAARAEVPAEEGVPTDRAIAFRLPAPAHDAYVVCVVTGAASRVPHFRTTANYTLGATNPVWIDGDGDGTWSRAGSGRFDGSEDSGG